MKIWITGIAGFLGSHLADQLIAEGHEVTGNDSLVCGDRANIPTNIKLIIDTSSKCPDPGIIDCANYDDIKSALDYFKPDVLIHCAATAHEGLSNFSPSFITRNVYEASVATFSAAIAAGVKRIVFMSSMSRYGRGRIVAQDEGIVNAGGRSFASEYAGPPFVEDFNMAAPVDPYGIAKVAAEDTLKVLCDTHGVKWSILVPHNIIGTRQRSIDPFRNVAAIMINRCKQGKPPIIYGDGSQTRCFSPVKDCLPSIVKAVHGEADGEVVNIGPDKGEITIKELANKIIQLTNYDGFASYMTDRPNEVKHAYCSSEKARRLLGYKEQQSIDDCLKEMVDYIQPQDFDYSFPIEIKSNICPKTWSERLM